MFFLKRSLRTAVEYKLTLLLKVHETPSTLSTKYLSRETKQKAYVLGLSLRFILTPAEFLGFARAQLLTKMQR